ncbi:hypothetical protein ASPZODRAFT_28887 [Penicilliopsis zonata CBS 506.65]|uniref:Serine hydrolase domain-containing protein n=1 Tax=Penicilliopsis zonata CBS 506.65 TaxID=1073090 RepID=A0A1L9S6J0_9EURO|nr:hypothetical protein ASPZODRAFT_28887 [Penicilliopsis zonata CBS 506.65]OJJ42802.1 hypothetical protein ASPZODRAFT_28887 [Penicilliopsis zonata CBS 506.65]
MAERKFRILMLHGYAQSASLFRIKTRLLREQILDSFPPALYDEYPGGIEYLFPDGAVSLSTNSKDSGDDDHEDGMRAWWLNLDDTSRYTFLNETIASLPTYLNHTPIDALIGFSQGGALAVMLASLCEAAASSPSQARRQSLRDQGIPVDAFLNGLPGQSPLRFVISLCGFRGTMDYYGSLYPAVGLTTPSLHAMGVFDSMIAGPKSQELVASFQSPQVVHYYGGHFIPRDRQTMQTIVAFIKAHFLVQKYQAENNPNPNPTASVRARRKFVPFRVRVSHRIIV